MNDFDITSNNSYPIQIGINAGQLARNLFIICLCIELGFVLLDYFVSFNKWTEYETLHRFLNIAREDSLASFFGTIQTLMVGLTLWLIVLIQNNAEASKKDIFGWCVLALFFTYMAVDDGAEIHERLGTIFEVMFESNGPLRPSASLGSRVLYFFPSYAWQIIFLPFFGITGLYVLFFLWNILETRNSKIIVIIALSCFIIAVGLDFIEGMKQGHPWNLQTMIMKKYNLRSFKVSHFSKSLEEFLEMVGITLFWITFVQHLKVILKKGVCFISEEKKGNE